MLLVLALASVVLFAPVIILFKYKKTSIMDDQATEFKRRQEWKITKTLGISAACTFWLYVLPLYVGLPCILWD